MIPFLEVRSKILIRLLSLSLKALLLSTLTSCESSKKKPSRRKLSLKFYIYLS